MIKIGLKLRIPPVASISAEFAQFKEKTAAESAGKMARGSQMDELSTKEDAADMAQESQLDKMSTKEDAAGAQESQLDEISKKEEAKTGHKENEVRCFVSDKKPWYRAGKIENKGNIRKN